MTYAEKRWVVADLKKPFNSLISIIAKGEAVNKKAALTSQVVNS